MPFIRPIHLVIRALTLVSLGLACAALSVPAASAPKTPPSTAPKTREWSGKWIWTDAGSAPRNDYAYFRTDIQMGGSHRDAKIFLTADSRYQLFLNGEFIGRGPVRSDRRWLYYDEWDLTEHMEKGRNVLAVLVHYIGDTTFQYMHGRGGLLADVVSGSGKLLSGTGAAWKAKHADAWIGGAAQPRMDLQLEFSEIYDARKEPVGWKSDELSDANWVHAVEIGPAGMEPWPHLIARDIPPMHEEPLAARKVLEVAAVQPNSPQPGLVSQTMAKEARLPNGQFLAQDPDKALTTEGGGAHVRSAAGADCSLLIDFGKEVTGFPRFRVRGAKGGEIIDAGYGEVLQDEKGGFVSPASGHLGRLNPDRDGVHYADRYICRPGLQTFITFDKRGFRYLQLDIRNAPAGIELDDVGIRFSTFPVEYRGSFQCSDDQLNRIWEIGRYTCQLNMEDGYTDCPWCERGQWWGDARLEALINYQCFGDATLIRKALRQVAESMNDEGMTWGVYPTDWDGGRLPSFTLIWVSTLWDMYRYTGDQDLVKELFPKIRYTLDHFFAPRVSSDGLLRDVPYWVFIDWAAVESDGESGALNAYYYDALRSAGQMAHLLNDPSAADYEHRAAAVKEAFQRVLWDPEQKVYRDSVPARAEKLSSKISQQTNSLCVLFDIAPADQQTHILDYLYDPANHGKVVEAGSPYFSFYQLAAMYHAHEFTRALAYTREHWGEMLDWGATTWWETWTPGASFCHGWSGGPTYDLEAHVLGIEPLKPGFAEVSVAPQWVGLSVAAGSIPTPKGDVRVAWQRDAHDGATALRVEVPDNVPVEVTIPESGAIRINKKSELPHGVTRLDAPRGSQRFRVEKGGGTLFELSRSQ